MAKQYCFYVDQNNNVCTEVFEYQYFGGFALSQKRKCIHALHSEIKNKLGLDILEISTKSESELGKNLSAINLKFKYSGKEWPVENLYLATRVYENNVQYLDLLDNVDPKKSKTDLRVKNSGEIIDYGIVGEASMMNGSKTAYYDWLWIGALLSNKDYIEELVKYSAFTDIVFSFTKGVNCQARAAAIFVSCYRRGIDLNITFDKYCELEKEILKETN